MKRQCPSCKKRYYETARWWVRHAGRNLGLGGWCRKCHNQKARDRAREHKESTRRKIMFKKYGWTLEFFQSVLERNGNRCQICKLEFDGSTKNQPNIDHDHKTGMVRGVLCRSCNTGIGHLKDSPDIMRSAIDYLDKAFAKYCEKMGKCL